MEKASTIIVWGADGCDQCAKIADELTEKGFTVEKHDYEAEEGTLTRDRKRDIMAAYAFQEAWPVLEILCRCETVKEAYKELNLDCPKAFA